MKLLDKVPILKSVFELPKKLADLERRVSNLEKNNGKGPRKIECGKCNHPMEVIHERVHPDGKTGHMLRMLKCSYCSHQTDRTWTETNGYI